MFIWDKHLKRCFIKIYIYASGWVKMYFHAKSKDSNYLFFKSAVAAIWLCVVGNQADEMAPTFISNVRQLYLYVL